MARSKRQAYIAERLLFGPWTCGIGGCNRDGVCQVALPYITFGGPPDYQGTEGFAIVAMCEEHAAAECQRHNRSKRQPTPKDMP